MSPVWCEAEDGRIVRWASAQCLDAADTHQLHPPRHPDHNRYTPVTPSHIHQLHPLTLTSYTLPATVTTLYTHQLHISYTLLKITLTSYTNYTHQFYPHRHSDHMKYTPVTPSHTHQLHPLLNYIHQSHPSRHCDHNSYTISHSHKLHSPVTPSLSPWQQYTIS